MSHEQKTRLTCDICLTVSISWVTPVSKTMARSVARERGWRVDKLNRDVCDRHPRLNRKPVKES